MHAALCSPCHLEAVDGLGHLVPDGCDEAPWFSQLPRVGALVHLGTIDQMLVARGLPLRFGERAMALDDLDTAQDEAGAVGRAR